MQHTAEEPVHYKHDLTGEPENKAKHYYQLQYMQSDFMLPGFLNILTNVLAQEKKNWHLEVSSGLWRMQVIIMYGKVLSFLASRLPCNAPTIKE